MIGMWENSEPGIIYDGLRSFCTIFDGIATTLLGGIYKVFFLVANATIVSDIIFSETLSAFAIKDALSTTILLPKTIDTRPINKNTNDFNIP